jgi:anti-sigma factor (TIGR02949 family)
MTLRDPALLECREVVEVVSDFLDGAMTAEDRARLEQHLLVCPPCTLHVAQVRATIEHIAALRGEQVPAEVGPALVSAFRHWAKRARDEDA